MWLTEYQISYIFHVRDDKKYLQVIEESRLGHPDVCVYAVIRCIQKHREDLDYIGEKMM